MPTRLNLAARDPVNIAGSAAANIVRGDVEPAYWDEWAALRLQERPIVVDVRNPPERTQFAVDETLHIPLPQLRKRLGELPSGREIWVHCAVGQRGITRRGSSSSGAFASRISPVESQPSE